MKTHPCLRKRRSNHSADYKGGGGDEGRGGKKRTRRRSRDRQTDIGRVMQVQRKGNKVRRWGTGEKERSQSRPPRRTELAVKSDIDYIKAFLSKPGTQCTALQRNTYCSQVTKLSMCVKQRGRRSNHIQKLVLSIACQVQKQAAAMLML